MEKNTHTETSTFPGAVPMVRIDGAKIRSLRESKQLTQLYLSTVVGVTTDTISRWENRHYQSIKRENAVKLAQALEVEFEDILKQEGETPIQEDPPSEELPQDEPPVQDPAKKKLIIALTTVGIIIIFCSILLYQRFSAPPLEPVSAVRILPPHIAPGQVFPVVIRVSSGQESVSLIIKELIPRGAATKKGLPEFTSIDRRENSLKWIRRLESDKSVYAYLCQAPQNLAADETLTFDGSITMKKNVSNRQKIGGATSLNVDLYHWADSNRDYMIDDEEILAVYDTYSDIEKLPFDRELIDSIWASSGYRWDSVQEIFIPID